MSGSRGIGGGLPQIADQRFLANFTGAPALPAATQLIAGANIVLTPGVSDLTIAATTGSTASGTVTIVNTGDGLTGGPITSSGTVSITTSGVTPAMLSFTPMGVLITSSAQSGTTTTIVFSSIPNTYRHLLVLASGRSDGGASVGVNTLVQFNADTGANYDVVAPQLQNVTYQANTAAGGTSIMAGIIPWSSSTALNAGWTQVLIFNYRDNSLFKTCRVEGASIGATTAGTTFVWRMAGGLWRSTASITTVSIALSAGNWATGSFASLYGLN